MRAIALGPDHVPDALFAGGRNAALRGLSVHANTISHARLVALEDTFPRSRAMLGEAAFNTLSRGYIEQAGINGLTLANIGRDFPDWLAASGKAGLAASLARFEWAWLQCYHAAEALPFGIDDLARRGEAGIANLVLIRHPASVVLQLEPEALALVMDHSDAPSDAGDVLIVRPAAEVLTAPISPAAARLHSAFTEPRLVCNLLVQATEPGSQEALLALIAKGALVEAAR